MNKAKIGTKMLSLKTILNNFTNVPNCMLGNNEKNTVLLIEPRKIYGLVFILNNAYRFLKNDWNYVFYCGKSCYTYWKNILPNFIEIRQLQVDNFSRSELYNDFCKNIELWRSLYGEYVLTIQADSWIMNKPPYDINYFLKLNKSFIGGNMLYDWGDFFKCQQLQTPNVRNFNGGLSLRKRMDMINVLRKYSPMPTNRQKRQLINEFAEDVYFTIGCYKLGLPVGDDEESSHFALHTIEKNNYFGIHNPSKELARKINRNYPHLKYLNKHLKLNS
jgi:hypothetical protein